MEEAQTGTKVIKVEESMSKCLQNCTNKNLTIWDFNLYFKMGIFACMNFPPQTRFFKLSTFPAIKQWHMPWKL